MTVQGIKNTIARWIDVNAMTPTQIKTSIQLRAAESEIWNLLLSAYLNLPAKADSWLDDWCRH